MRRKGLKRRRVPESLDDVKAEIQRLVARGKRRSAGRLSEFDDEIDGLLAALSELRPEWVQAPCVHRLALVETRFGTAPYEETVMLPDIEHTYAIELEMLGHIRRQKGLSEVKMPIFLYPDEIELALDPAEPVSPSAVVAQLPDKELEQVSDRRRRKVVRRKDWSETRRATLDRDDWECRKCGALKDLELYRVDDSLDEYDIDGYITLCAACLPLERREIIFRGRRLVPDDVIRIRSQLALGFQRGSVERVGFVLGGEYFVLDA